MKLFLIVLLLAFQAEPTEFPPGWFCSPRGIERNGRQMRDHPCNCKRVATGDDCENIGHHSACSQYCHEDHCKCPIVCEPTVGKS